MTAIAAFPAGAAQIVPDTTHITITGLVYDRGSGTPIQGAQIRLRGVDLQITTGDDGRYTVEGLSRRVYPIEVSATGYRSIGGDLRLLKSGEMNFPLDALGGATPGGRASRIVGLVLEMETGRPIEGAEIRLTGRSSTLVTDGRGRFQMAGLTPGAHRISVGYLGRTTVETRVEVPEESTVDVEIRLSVKPVELAPIVVTVTPRNSYLEDMGFYRRRDEGRSGIQMSRVQLEERAPRSLADVFVSLPGLRVLPGQLGRFEVRMKRAIRLTVDGGEGCVPTLFVDDLRSDPGWLQDLDPERVEALEVYAGANAPLRYNDPCGVILVWTRRGQRGGGGAGVH